MGLQENIRRMFAGKCVDPFAFLGMHPVKDEYGTSLQVRAFCLRPKQPALWMKKQEYNIPWRRSTNRDFIS